jgi:hypothetical protein
MTTITRLHTITPDEATTARIVGASKQMEKRYSHALGSLLASVPGAVAAYERGDDEDLRMYLAHALGALAAINAFQGETK